jgi:hypothetical protein
MNWQTLCFETLAVFATRFTVKKMYFICLFMFVRFRDWPSSGETQ